MPWKPVPGIAQLSTSAVANGSISSLRRASKRRLRANGAAPSDARSWKSDQAQRVTLQFLEAALCLHLHRYLRYEDDNVRSVPSHGGLLSNVTGA